MCLKLVTFVFFLNWNFRLQFVEVELWEKLPRTIDHFYLRISLKKRLWIYIRIHNIQFGVLQIVVMFLVSFPGLFSRFFLCLRDVSTIDFLSSDVAIPCDLLQLRSIINYFKMCWLFIIRFFCIVICNECILQYCVCNLLCLFCHWLNYYL